MPSPDSSGNPFLPEKSPRLYFDYAQHKLARGDKQKRLQRIAGISSQNYTISKALSTTW